MQEGTGKVRRGQAEPEENSHNEKWRKREGIKRRLQDEPTQPTLPPSSSIMPVYHQANEIHMHEGAGGVKRGQTELEKNLHHDKWRKREGIKRGLRDIPCVQYKEYEASWDQEIQAKKCKGSINSILDRCDCMESSTENLAHTVRISPLTHAMRDQQAGMIAALSVQPERASTASWQWYRAILTLQLLVSQQGTQGGVTGHRVVLCFVRV